MLYTDSVVVLAIFCCIVVWLFCFFGVYYGLVHVGSFYVLSRVIVVFLCFPCGVAGDNGLPRADDREAEGNHSRPPDQGRSRCLGCLICSRAGTICVLTVCRHGTYSQDRMSTFSTLSESEFLRRFATKRQQLPTKQVQTIGGARSHALVDASWPTQVARLMTSTSLRVCNIESAMS